MIGGEFYKSNYFPTNHTTHMIHPKLILAQTWKVDWKSMLVSFSRCSNWSLWILPLLEVQEGVVLILYQDLMTAIFDLIFMVNMYQWERVFALKMNLTFPCSTRTGKVLCCNNGWLCSDSDAFISSNKASCWHNFTKLSFIDWLSEVSILEATKRNIKKP